MPGMELSDFSFCMKPGTAAELSRDLSGSGGAVRLLVLRDLSGSGAVVRRDLSGVWLLILVCVLDELGGLGLSEWLCVSFAF